MQKYLIQFESHLLYLCSFVVSFMLFRWRRKIKDEDVLHFVLAVFLILYGFTFLLRVNWGLDKWIQSFASLQSASSIFICKEEGGKRASPSENFPRSSERTTLS